MSRRYFARGGRIYHENTKLGKKENKRFFFVFPYFRAFVISFMVMLFARGGGFLPAARAESRNGKGDIIEIL